VSRYYKIAIKSINGGKLYQPPGFEGLLGDASYTSFVNGATLPAAWDVEIDVPVIPQDTSQGFGTVRVWGISLQEIAQANDLGAAQSGPKYNIELFGGMQKGLPLANPAQSGLLYSGIVYQCFGNWIGHDMTLDFVIAPGPGSASFVGGVGSLKGSNQLNFTLDWKQGQQLGPALQSTLSTVYKGYTINVNVSSDLVLNNDAAGAYATLEQLAQAVRQISLGIKKTQGYQGVSITLQGTTITASDGSSQSTGSSGGTSGSVQIAFQDLIGQPTWIESPAISIKTVMRADLSIGQTIMLPPTLVTNTASALSSLTNQRANFQGGFQIYSLRHIGAYRQASADSWVTVIEAFPSNPQSSFEGDT
jgi:hypothetical protein